MFYHNMSHAPVYGTLGPLGPPAWAFTTALKGGALAHISVAGRLDARLRVRRRGPSSASGVRCRRVRSSRKAAWPGRSAPYRCGQVQRSGLSWPQPDRHDPRVLRQVGACTDADGEAHSVGARLVQEIDRAGDTFEHGRHVRVQGQFCDARGPGTPIPSAGRWRAACPRWRGMRRGEGGAVRSGNLGQRRQMLAPGRVIQLPPRVIQVLPGAELVHQPAHPLVVHGEEVFLRFQREGSCGSANSVGRCVPCVADSSGSSGRSPSHGHLRSMIALPVGGSALRDAGGLGRVGCRGKCRHSSSRTEIEIVSR